MTSALLLRRGRESGQRASSRSKGAEGDLWRWRIRTCSQQTQRIRRDEKRTCATMMGELTVSSIPLDALSDVSESSRDEIREACGLDVYQERFRVDRPKLEQMMQGESKHPRTMWLCGIFLYRNEKQMLYLFSFVGFFCRLHYRTWVGFFYCV